MTKTSYIEWKPNEKVSEEVNERKNHLTTIIDRKNLTNWAYTKDNNFLNNIIEGKYWARNLGVEAGLLSKIFMQLWTASPTMRCE